MFKRGVLIAEIALAVICVFALYLKQSEIAIGCVTAIAATLNQLTETKFLRRSD